LEKAHQDGASLKSALKNQDDKQVRFLLFDFAVAAYHIWDWIKVQRPELNAAATNPVDLYESIRVCRDLANASKHMALNLAHRSYRDRPLKVQEVVVSAITSWPADETSSEDESASEATGRSPFRLKIQEVSSGKRWVAEELVDQVLTDWHQYFDLHSI
jgi:hypothetical protein